MKAHLWSQFADLTGDGSGTDDFTGDFSAGNADEAYIKPAAGKQIRVNRLLVCVGDTSGMAAEEYGNLGSALTNGIEIKIRSTNPSGVTEIADLTGGKPLKTNADWGRQCYDVDIKSWGTTPTNELLVARYTFAKHGAPIDLDEDDEIAITLNDSFVGLTTQTFLFQGLVF